MQHFPAGGEGKDKHTDGIMPAMKAHRKSAMRAGEPDNCVTPESEVIAQQYMGGLPGCIARVLDISYKEQKPLRKNWKGIMSLHNFLHLPGGNIRCWRSYQIGPGKFCSSNWLDKMYHPSPEDSKKMNCQGSTNCKLREVKCKYSDENDGIQYKLEKSATRKREEMRLRERHERASAAATHAEAEPVSAPNRKRKRRTKIEPEPFTLPAKHSLDDALTAFTEVEMGHGLNNFRNASNIDPAAVVILEEQYQVGVVKRTNKKGMFDMHQACQQQLPSLLVPTLTEIGRWLQSRLSRDKKKDEGKKGRGRRRNTAKSQSEKRQALASTISKAEADRRFIDDKFSREMFRNKYLGIILEYDPADEVDNDIVDSDDSDNEGELGADDVEIRIVTDLLFDDDDERWYVQTDLAVESELDPDAMVPADSGDNNDLVNILIDSRAVGRYIKRYNERKACYWSEDVD